MNDKRFEKILRQRGDAHIPQLNTLFPSHQKRRSWRPLWVSLTALLLVFLILPIINRSQVEASVLYLEFNPSLRLELDEDWVILSIQQELDSTHPWDLASYVGQDLDGFILSYITQAIALGWVDQDTHFLYDVVHPDDEVAQTLVTAFEATLVGRFPQVIRDEQLLRGNMLNITENERAQAKLNQMTVMRSRLIEEILSQDETLSFEDLAAMPLGLLRQQWAQNPPPRRPDQRPPMLPPHVRP